MPLRRRGRPPGFSTPAWVALRRLAPLRAGAGPPAAQTASSWGRTLRHQAGEPASAATKIASVAPITPSAGPRRRPPAPAEAVVEGRAETASRRPRSAACRGRCAPAIRRSGVGKRFLTQPARMARRARVGQQQRNSPDGAPPPPPPATTPAARWRFWKIEAGVFAHRRLGGGAMGRNPPPSPACPTTSGPAVLV